MSLTYRQLLDRLKTLSDEHLDQDVSVLILNDGEVFGVVDFVSEWPDRDTEDYDALGTGDVEDVLDDDHPYFTMTY